MSPISPSNSHSLANPLVVSQPVSDISLEEAKTALKSIHEHLQLSGNAENDIDSIVDDLNESQILNNKIIQNIKQNVLKHSSKDIKISKLSTDDINADILEHLNKDITEYYKITASVIQNLKDAGRLNSMLELVLQYRLDRVDNIIQNLKQGNGLMTQQTLQKIFQKSSDRDSERQKFAYDYFLPATPRNIAPIKQELQKLENLHGLENLQALQKLQNLKNLYGLENLQALQNLENLYGSENLQALQRLQNLHGLDIFLQLQIMNEMLNFHGSDILRQRAETMLQQQGLPPVVKLQTLRRLQGHENLRDKNSRDNLIQLQTPQGLQPPPPSSQQQQILQDLQGLDNSMKLQSLENLYGAENLQALQRLQSLCGLDNFMKLQMLQSLYGLDNFTELRRLQSLCAPDTSGVIKSYEAHARLFKNISNSGTCPQVLIKPERETAQFEKTPAKNRVRYTNKFLKALADLKLLSKLTRDDLHIIIKNAETGFIDIAAALLEKNEKSSVITIDKTFSTHELAELIFNYLAEAAPALDDMDPLNENVWDKHTGHLTNKKIDELLSFLQFFIDTLPESNHRKNLKTVHGYLRSDRGTLMHCVLQELKEADCFNYQIIKEIVNHAEDVETILHFINELLELMGWIEANDTETFQTNLQGLCQHIKVFSWPGVWEAIQRFPAEAPWDAQQPVQHRHPQNLQGAFNTVIDLCNNNERTDQPLDLATIANRVIWHLHEWLGIFPGQIGGFNPEQSIHTGSVEVSISEAALKLYERYTDKPRNGNPLYLIFKQKEKQTVEVTLKQIETYVNGLETEEITKDTTKLTQKMINRAAQRCFEKLKNYTFIEKHSGIDIRTLLGLVWCAANDETNPESPPQILKDNLILGLYEIQRGSNIDNNAHIDDLRPTDGKICVPGAFSKLVETLWNRHPDVMKIEYVNQTTVVGKLAAMVREQVIKHFEREINKCTDANMYRQVVHSLNEVKKHDLGQELWAKIKDKVYESVYSKEEDKAKKLSVALEYEMMAEKDKQGVTFTSFYKTFSDNAYQLDLTLRQFQSLWNTLLDVRVREEAIRHLKDSIEGCQDANECTAVVHSLNEVEKNGLGQTLWAKIKDKVEYDFISEDLGKDFVSFYTTFSKEKAAQVKLTPENHNALRKTLSESEGYTSYLTQSLYESLKRQSTHSILHSILQHKVSQQILSASKNSQSQSIYKSLKRQSDDSNSSSIRQKKVKPASSTIAEFA